MKKLFKIVARGIYLFPALGVLLLGNPFAKGQQDGGVATLFNPDEGGAGNGSFEYFSVNPETAYADVPDGSPGWSDSPYPDCPADGPGPGPDGC